MAGHVYMRQRFKDETADRVFDIFLRAWFFGWSIQIAKQYAVYHQERTQQAGGKRPSFRTPEGWYCSLFSGFKWNGTNWAQEKNRWELEKPDPETGIIKHIKREPVYGLEAEEVYAFLTRKIIGTTESEEEIQLSKRANNGSRWIPPTRQDLNSRNSLPSMERTEPEYLPVNPYKDSPDKPLVWQIPFGEQKKHKRRPPKRVTSVQNPNYSYNTAGDFKTVKGGNPHCNPETFDRITTYCWGLVFTNEGRIRGLGNARSIEEATNLPNRDGTEFARTVQLVLEYLKMKHPVFRNFKADDLVASPDYIEQAAQYLMVMSDWLEDQQDEVCTDVRRLFGG